MHKMHWLGLVVVTQLLVSCASVQLDDPSILPKAPLPPAAVMPSKNEVNYAKYKVVIFSPNNSANALARSANVGNSIAAALEIQIAEGGSDIVDRTIANVLEEEIRLAEMRGRSEYHGPNIADFAITGTVTETKIKSSFSKEERRKLEDGSYSVSPASCTHVAQIEANLRVYSLPEIKYVKSFSIKRSKKLSQETNNSRCPLAQAEREGLVRAAATRAVNVQREVIKNYFARKAYVLERRLDKRRNLFKLSAGEIVGLKPNLKVVFYQVRRSRNGITGEVVHEVHSVAEGQVSTLVGPNYAWVYVDDEEDATKIRMGDYAKANHSVSGFKKVGRALNDWWSSSAD